MNEPTKIVGYQMISGDYPSEINRNAEPLIKQGYEPYGLPIVRTYGSHQIYQAFVLRATS